MVYLKKFGFYLWRIYMCEKRNACDSVKEYLFNQIESKKLGIGSRLPTEKQLTDTLHVSRTSVREALQSLKGVGLVKSVRGSGYEIVSNTENILSDAFRAIMSLKDIQFTDISNIREALDIKAAELAIVRRIATEDFEYLQNCIDKMVTFSNNPEKVIEFDTLFHKKIAELSQNEFIKSFILTLSSFSNKYTLISWDKVKDNEAHNLFWIHREILYYLRAEDINEVTRKIKEHYRIADSIINAHIETVRNKNTNVDTLISQLLAMGYTNDQICSELTDLINTSNKQ